MTIQLIRDGEAPRSELDEDGKDDYRGKRAKVC